MMVCCESLPDAQFENEENCRENVKVLDMDTLAFSHLASFLIDHDNTTPGHLFCKGPKVQCVEIACDQGNNSTEVHRLIHQPRTHPIFQGESALSAVSTVCFPFSRLHRTND